MIKFYRTVYQIEVLSDIEPPSFPNLEQIAYDITDGHSSGVLNEVSREEVDRNSMAKLLTAQGSDPAFLLESVFDDEEHLARFREGIGKTPEATPERAARLAALPVVELNTGDDND